MPPVYEKPRNQQYPHEFLHEFPHTSSDPSPPPSEAAPHGAPIRRNRRNRQSGQPPRPQNSFLFFKNEFCKPPSSTSNIGHEAGRVWRSLSPEEAGRAWRNLSPEEQAPYKQKADLAKQQHARDYPGYKFCPQRRPKKEKKPKRSEKIAVSASDTQETLDNAQQLLGYHPPSIPEAPHLGTVPVPNAFWLEGTHPVQSPLPTPASMTQSQSFVPGEHLFEGFAQPSHSASTFPAPFGAFPAAVDPQELILDETSMRGFLHQSMQAELERTSFFDISHGFN